MPAADLEGKVRAWTPIIRALRAASFAGNIPRGDKNLEEADSLAYNLKRGAQSVIPKRALTLWQPWAWLVANGHKPIENRPPGFSHKSFRGDFWIHAGSGSRDRSERVLGEQYQVAAKLCREILGRDPIPPLTTLAYGAIIGRATITGIISPRHSPLLKQLSLPAAGTPVPWHFPDQYGFIVTNAQPLATPVPCRGYQGFWSVPADVLEKLSEAA